MSPEGGHPEIPNENPFPLSLCVIQSLDVMLMTNVPTANEDVE